MVDVTPESPSETFARLGAERCVVCQKETPYWYGVGCMPLCPGCAAPMSEATAYAMARDGGFGPLPEEPSDD